MGKYNFDEFIERKNSNSQNVEGWRPYIFKCGPEKVFPYKDEDFVRMWVADMEFAVAPEIRQAISERLDKKILGYTMVYDEECYTTFENWCRDRYNFTFKREELVFSPGVIPALYILAENLVAKDEKILTFTPAYGFFLHAAEYIDVEMEQCPLKIENGRFDLDFEDFEKKASDPKVKMLFLCNPHNPSGRIWTPEELKRIGEIAAANDLWIVSDEIHCDLVRTGLSHTPMAVVMPEYQKLVTCMSASKTFNIAGLMHSEIIIRDAATRAEFMRRMKTLGSVNPLSIEAHRAAFGQGGEWLKELREYIDGNMQFVKDFLKENIPEAEFEIPGATYFAWVNMGKALPEVKDLPMFFANNAGVLLEGGDELFVGNAKGYIRLNLAMQRSVIEKGMKRMKEAIDKYNRGEAI